MGPNVVQLKDVIKNGDNSQDNVLVLKVNGEFELVPGVSIEAVKGVKYVSRWETFDANSNYTGPAASEDKWLIDLLMKWANEVWDEYKKTGKCPILNNYA